MIKHFTTKHFHQSIWNVFLAHWKLALASFTFLLCTVSALSQPTTQASNISVLPNASSATSLTFTWNNGNGTNRIVIVRTGVYSPTDGVAAPASNPAYGAGSDLDPGGGGGSEAYCVFNSQTDGGGNSVTVTGLTDKQVYYVQVFEYTGTGASTLFHITAGARNPIAVQSFATNGTFNQPASVTKVSVAAWGGGGGGGGADSNGSENRAGGGGGGGTYTFNGNVTIAGNQTVTIGAGGAGGSGTNSPTNGSPGGTTTFGALVSAVGGSGGFLGDGTDRTGNGGAATTGTTANGGAGGEAPPGGTTTDATASGAGGASGGPGGNGGNATGSTAGSAVSGGGAGAPGNTSSPPTEGNNATQLGGGGSGGWDNLQNDNGGNGSNGGNGFRGQAIVTWTGPPVPVVSVQGPSPTNGNPVFKVVFSTPINTGSFTGGDVTLSGTATGTLSSAITEIAPNNGTTFTITVSGMTGSGTVIASIGAGVLQDVSGNNNLASNAGTTINYNHDTTGPTVTISVSGPNPTNANPVFQVVFNEPINVSTFTAGDIALTGTAGATTAVIAEIAPNDGTTFTITASGMTGAGTVIADIAAGLIEDLAATPNTNSASNAGTTITYDNVPPSVVLNDDHPDNIVRDADIVEITAVFTEANGISGTPTISIGSLVTNAPMSGAGLTWTYSWDVPSGNNGSHAVTISATDAAGNPNSAATAGTGPTSYIIDNIAPTVVLNDDHPDALVRDADNVLITAVFTEANGIAGTPTISIGTLVTNDPMSGAGLSWTYNWNVPAGNDGPHAVSISATDVAGNPNAPATAGTGQTTYTIDNTPPVISATAPSSGSSVSTTQVSYTLSENAVSGSITWANTGGTTDPGAPHVQALTAPELTSGPHNNIILTNNPTLVNGATYSMIFNATDAAGNQAVTVTNVNITFETATSSSIIPISTPVPISSLKNSSGNSANVLQFTIYDDGQDPISPNVMKLELNGTLPEVISFTLQEPLTLSDGATVTGFSSSTGSIGSAIYTAATKKITLTSSANGNWNAGTTISYSANTGNAQFVTLGKMQQIDNHSVAIASQTTQVFTTSGSFVVPAGVTQLIVEAWGAGGGGGAGVGGSFWDGGGGGGGGAYSRSVLTVIPGNAYGYTVGVGGFGINGTASSFAGLVIAPGGFAGQPNTGSNVGAGGSGGPLGTGDIRFAGGSGRSGFFGSSVPPPYGFGGGGGSSAGSGANGTNATSSTGAVAPFEGGNGGSGIDFGTGFGGAFPGGGAGGSGGGSGGAGANGRVRITYTDPTPIPGPSDWDGDTSPFKFSELIITQGTGNSAALSNWQDILAGAELFDGTNTIAGVVNPTNITFSSIPSTTNADLGFIDDANGAISSKTYTLRVWLRNNLSSSLAATVDNLFLAFNIDPTLPANITYNDVSNGQLSSRLIDTHPTVESGGKQIDVVATQLDFSTHPNPTQLVLLPVTSPSGAPDFTTFPVVRARDANGNTDLNFGGVNAITLASTAPLSPSPVTMTNGVAQLSSAQYQDSGVGTITASTTVLATNGLAPSAGISSAATVNYSNTSRIIPGDLPTPATFSSLNTVGFVQVFDFKVVDDNGSGGDGSPTRISQIVYTPGPGNDVANWTEALSQVLLFDGFNPTITGTIGANTITFSGISPSGLGFVADNGTKNYRLYITLKDPLGGTLQDDIDNRNLVFEVLDDNITLSPLSSLFTGSEGVNSGSGNIAVDVVATKLQFDTHPAANLLVSKDISLQPPVPVVEALDARNNRDLDFNSTTVNTTNSGALIMSNQPSNTSIVNGLLTFPANFQFNTESAASITLNVAATGPSAVTSATSNSFTVQAGTATTITSGPLAPATISSLETNSGSPVTVFNFNVNDDPGGTAANNDDGLATLISSLVITANPANNSIADWSQAIDGAFLDDGSSPPVSATSITTNSIVFSGIPTTIGTLGNVPDNATKTYSLQIYLKATLGGTLPTTIDGLQFEFQVLQSNITLAANSTRIIPAESETSGDRNVVDVTATTLRFLNPLAPTSASLDTDFPGISVEAVDANNNRDLDFTGASGTVRELTNPAGATMTNAPVVNTTQFSSGLLNFASNFRYTTGTNGDDVTITIKAGAGGTTCGVDAICATSPMITLQSSFESSIVADPTFTFSPTLAYVNHQEPANIQNTSTSLEIARMLLVDGSRTFPLFTYGGAPLNTGTNLDGLPDTDQDGAGTVLNAITVRITNPSNLRRIALYSGGVEVGTEIDVTAIGAINASTPSYDFVFSGSPLLIAPDDNIAPLSIRVSFRGTAPEVTDGDPLDVQVISATLGTGSGFFTGPPAGTYVAGQDPGYQSPPGVNLVNVIATKLDFVVQPAAFAGINRAVTAGTVEAHDQLGLLDTNFASGATISAAVPVNGSFSFASGILDLSAMQYGNPGDGTLTINAGGLSSDVNNTVNGLPNVAIPCTQVDVLHVATSYTDGGPGGVVTSPNLVGGTSNKVVFGFKFVAPHTVTSPSNHPLVSKFTITFSQPTAGVFLNMRVFESTNPSYNPSLPEVSTLGATISQPTPNTLEVDFSGSPRDLVAFPDLSYFLMVDIDINASGSTPQMTISVVDDNIEFSATDNNILVSNGTSSSNTFLPVAYTFAAVFPPTLDGSYPAAGQSNVDPNQPKLELVFSVPVLTLDNEVRLHDKVSGAVTVLPAANGQFSGGIAAQPIVFDIPPGTMVANREYYVTIAQGNRTNLTGIMDESENLFPGISFSGTLFFKTSDFTPPRLLGASTTPSATSPNVTDITPTGATLNATFDRNGRAYFLVLATNSTPPTNDQIKGTTPYLASPVIARGDFNVDSSYPVSQYGLISPISGSFGAGAHFVWMYAEAFVENDHVKTAIPTSAPYGGAASNFAEGASGPTLTFNVTAPGTTSIKLNQPSISICNNSYQILNAPIIISELQNSQFNAGTSAVQKMNIVLPAGFQFDVTKNASNLPKYGTLTLQGNDFITGSGSLQFLGNSILTIEYRNNSSTSFDKIIISGLRVIASGSSTGPMFRLGGNALPAIPDETPLAVLSSFNAPFIEFDNSYSTDVLGISQPGAVVTAIPDNTIPQSIFLTPYINPSSNDFGPSSFTGTGVNVNVLNLSAVTLDVPFNITINHTDQNGCSSSNAVQYLVYDHTTAVNITNGGTPDQGPYCATNDQFVIDAVNSPTYGQVGKVRDVVYNNLPSHFMETLTAAIPANANQLVSNGGPIINSVEGGNAWVPIIQNLPKLVSTINIGGINYRSYNFDEAEILDANAISGGALPDPYSYFRELTPFQNNTYYTGGSLGLVEFTGTYRNSSNTTVLVPRRQLVEIFVPAVPIVEVGLANRSFLDTADPLNPVGAGGPSNTGTSVFCEEGGLIAINGYPAATAGVSIGTFTLQDAATNTPIVTAALVDNSNGTANLDPSQFAATYPGNPYQDIRIIYTFKANNSPCQSSGSLIIRIAPNPLAQFDQASLITAVTPVGTAYCADNTIEFDGSLSGFGPNGAGGTTITEYSWNFGDNINSSPTNPNTITGAGTDPADGGGTIEKPYHKFVQSAPYVVQLNATTSVGCSSTTPAVATINVGAIPVVGFAFDGVSIADPMAFTDNTTVTSGGGIVDGIGRIDWDFGLGQTPQSVTSGFATPVLNNYSAAGPYTVTETVTSALGCVSSATKSVVMLEKFVATDATPYEESFDASNGNWQVLKDPTFAGTATWAWGAPTTGTITKTIDPPPLPDNNVSLWTTNLSGSYAANEQSYLYSTCIDMTGLLRPMISFNSFVQLAQGDGVVLEYSLDTKNITDPTKQWILLGDYENSIESGVDWYEASALPSKPGNQTVGDYGWAGDAVKKWMHSKHILDEVNNPVPQGNVVFRFALSSINSSPNRDGFAIDNVRIGNRTRTVLVENFTNKGNPAVNPNNGLNAELVESNLLKGFNPGGSGTKLVKVNYHVGFPRTDPFNADNPADPSARALYYNVTETPRARLDGFKNNGTDDYFSNWGDTQYGIRTLQLAQADLVLSTSLTPDNGLQVDVQVIARVALPATARLHVAMLERSIATAALSNAKANMIVTGETDFEYVLKKMLPSAVGTSIGGLMLQTDPPRNFTFEWYPDRAKLYDLPDDLAVVAFLQDDATKEILQSEILEGIADPPLVTGLDLESIAERIDVYPNPADHKLTIEFPAPVRTSTKVQLASQWGVITNQGAIEPGETAKELDTSDLAAGVYILQLESSSGQLVRRKIVIVHSP
ncbi:MAG: T9SS type A sorting domain-containing protein [Cyclobacteriaceae bacterium]